MTGSSSGIRCWSADGETERVLGDQPVTWVGFDSADGIAVGVVADGSLVGVAAAFLGLGG